MLVRYLVQDDRQQAGAANRVIEKLTQESPAFVSMIVLCEVAWVLRSAYSVSKEQCAHTLGQILAIPTFHIEQHDRCYRALRAYQLGTADYSDYLIRETAWEAGYDTVVTFDKRALKHKGFSKP